jgi:hypothetical protein
MFAGKNAHICYGCIREFFEDIQSEGHA